MVYDFLCFPRDYGKFYHIDNTDCPDLGDLYNAYQRRLHFYDILAGVGSMVFISMRDMLGSNDTELKLSNYFNGDIIILTLIQTIRYRIYILFFS